VCRAARRATANFIKPLVEVRMTECRSASASRTILNLPARILLLAVRRGTLPRVSRTGALYAASSCVAHSRQSVRVLPDRRQRPGRIRQLVRTASRSRYEPAPGVSHQRTGQDVATIALTCQELVLATRYQVVRNFRTMRPRSGGSPCCQGREHRKWPSAVRCLARICWIVLPPISLGSKPRACKAL
jgi:hypothetical protein